MIEAHGRNTFYHFGAVGFGKVDVGESAADAGGGGGFFDFVYDAGAAGVGDGWAVVSLYDP